MKKIVFLFLSLQLLMFSTLVFALTDTEKLANNEALMMLSAHVYELDMPININDGIEVKVVNPSAPPTVVQKWAPWVDAPNWSLIAYRDNLYTGVTVGVYKNDTDKELIIAFGGTGGGSHIDADIVEDLKLLDPFADSTAFSDAKLTISNYLGYFGQSDANGYISSGPYSGYTLRFTGHSLGGAMAQFAGLEFNVPVVTFNTAPFSLSGNVRAIFNSVAVTRFENNEGNIINYRAANDYVSAIPLVLKPLSKSGVMPGEMITLNSYITGHTIAQMIRNYDAKYVEVFDSPSPVTQIYNSYSLYIANQANVMLAVGGRIIDTGYVLKDVVVSGAKTNILANFVINELTEVEVNFDWLGNTELISGYTFKEYFTDFSTIFSVSWDVLSGVTAGDWDTASRTIITNVEKWPLGYEEAQLTTNMGKLLDSVANITLGTTAYSNELAKGVLINQMSDIVAGVFLKMAKVGVSKGVLRKINKATVKKRLTERIEDSLFLNKNQKFSGPKFVKGILIDRLIEIIADEIGAITGSYHVRGWTWFFIKESLITYEAFWGCKPNPKCGPIVSKAKLALLQAELLGAVIQKDIEGYEQLEGDTASLHVSKINGILQDVSSVIHYQYGQNVTSYYRATNDLDVGTRLARIITQGQDAVNSYVNSLHYIPFVQDPDEVRIVANSMVTDWALELKMRLEKSRMQAIGYLYRLLAEGETQKAEEVVLLYGTGSDISSFYLEQYLDDVLTTSGVTELESDLFYNEMISEAGKVDFIYAPELQSNMLYIDKSVAKQVGVFYSTVENKWNVLLAVKSSDADNFEVVPFTIENYFEGSHLNSDKGYFINIDDKYFTKDSKITVALFDPKIYEYALASTNAGYLDAAINQDYVSDGNGVLRKNALTIQIDRAVEGSSESVRVYTETGLVANTFLEITLPTGTGRSLVTDQLAFNALAGDSVTLREVVGSAVDTGVAQCWSDAPANTFPGYSFQTYRVWLRKAPTGELVSVDATRSADCHELSFTIPSDGEYQLIRYDVLYADAGNQTKVLGGTGSFSGVNQVVLGVVDTSGVSQPPQPKNANESLVSWGGVRFRSNDFKGSVFTAISSASSYSLALKQDGTVIEWGLNNSISTVPIGLKNVAAIEAGINASFAIKYDGTVDSWGSSLYGLTSIASTLTGIKDISVGYKHAVALKQDGTVVAWGDNTYGQINAPVNINTIIGISASANYSLALKQDGSIVAWGDNTYGQTTIPAGLTNVVSISAGFSHVLALKQDGTVVAWGDNSYGQTVVPTGLTNIVAISTGFGYSSVALKKDGTVVAWGDNTYGQTVIPAGLTNVVAISAGNRHVLALKQDGTIVAWGGGESGQKIMSIGFDNIKSIAVGNSHSLAINQDGTVVGWGANTYGQATVPSGLTNVKGVAVGLSHSLVLKQDGTVIAWGDNTFGDTNVPIGLANVSDIDAKRRHSLALKQDGTVVGWGFDSPAIPTGLVNVAAISTGDSHSLALKSDGTVIAWGDGSFGKVTVPPGLDNVIAVEAGGEHSLALKSDGTVVAWGRNNIGQTNVPIGLTGVVAISAGKDHSLALKNDGVVVAWGRPNSGQTVVPSGLEKVTLIAANDTSSLAWGIIKAEENPIVTLLSENIPDYTSQLGKARKRWSFTSGASTLNGLKAVTVSQDPKLGIHQSEVLVGDVTANTSFDVVLPIAPIHGGTAIQQAVLKLVDGSGNIIPISNSATDTFWLKLRTNHPPQFNPNQSLQLSGLVNTGLILDLTATDTDGDALSFSITPTAGVSLNGNRITANFNDGLLYHTVTVAVSDGIETTEAQVDILTFTSLNVLDLYADVNGSGTYDNFIAYATLKGLVIGNAESGTRNFYPNEQPSWSELLKMMVNAAAATGAVTIPTDNWLKAPGVVPPWVDRFYTTARLANAVDADLDLTASPTNEDVTRLIVKLLGLDRAVDGLNVSAELAQFTAGICDAITVNNCFNSNINRYEAKLVKLHGLFMRGMNDDPQGLVTRAQITEVMSRMILMPSASLQLDKPVVEFGGSVTLSLANLSAPVIKQGNDFILSDSDQPNPVNHMIVDYIVVDDVIILPSSVAMSDFNNQLINSTILSEGLHTAFVKLENTNSGTYSYQKIGFEVSFTDSDYDGVQDINDLWPNNSLYSDDENGNGIPDFADLLWGLNTADSTTQVMIDGVLAGYTYGEALTNNYYFDWLDDDFDGVPDLQDAYPLDQNEFVDSDGDGIGDNADIDDDNDLIPDSYELLNGLNPLDSNDADSDYDGDGLTALEEFNAGTRADLLDTDFDGDSDSEELAFGADPNNPLDNINAHRPYAPVLGTFGAAHDVSNMTLYSNVFTDPDELIGDVISADQWQLAKTITFDSLAIDRVRIEAEMTDNGTTFAIPNGLLKKGLSYYYRARHRDKTGLWSDWSVAGSFNTLASSALDLDADGVADLYQVNTPTDVDNNGVEDSLDNIKVMLETINNEYVGISLSPATNLSGSEIVSVSPLPNAQLPAVNLLQDKVLPYGMFEFMVDATSSGINPQNPTTVDVTLYFPRALPSGTTWMKFDTVTNKLIDYTDHVTFFENTATISLTDGGLGDLDKVVNGYILDPGGPVLPINPDDVDNDGIANALDNCLNVANPNQVDVDADGYGNYCDADFTNDGIVNALDLGLFKQAFFTFGNVVQDLNGDGVINSQDLGLFKQLFFKPPGPSGLMQ